MPSLQPLSVVRLPATHTPLLTVIVDTEAEFDWSQPVSRGDRSVRSVRQILRHMPMFEYYRIKPVHVVDYAVASQRDGYQPLRELSESGVCVIGAHLQPWTNPPYTENIAHPASSYPGNLPETLEREKLLRLTRKIEENFALTPTIYRAGRYGVGQATGRILVDLGYRYEVSVVPYTDFRRDHGPDFTPYEAEPSWCGPGGGLLEIPLTVGFTGLLSRQGVRLYPRVTRPLAKALHAPGVLARTRLLDRIRLSPEGITLAEMRRLTRVLLRRGHRIFSLNYHSPSMEPGHTPYVQTEDDLRGFLARLEGYLDFFFGEVGGRAVTPAEIEAIAIQHGCASPRTLGPISGHERQRSANSRPLARAGASTTAAG